MAFSSGGRRRATLSEINVTPFVDIVLVLLVIFMITAPMLQTGIQVRLPRATLDAIPTDDKPRVITIDKKGSVHLGSTAYTEREVETKLMATLAREPEKPIYVRADESLSYGTVARFMGRLHRVGLKKVSLVTEPVSKP